MKRKILPYCALVAFIFMTTLSTENCYAQKIKIKKTKGLSAMIESSVPLEEGQVYDLQTQALSQDVDYKSTKFKSRQNSISIGGNLVSLRSDDYQKNLASLQVRYGWNLTNLEFGSVLNAESEDVGAGATTDFTAGGYFDYNLIGNRDPKYIIYGVLSLITFGTRQFPASSGSGSATTLEMNLGGFLSWFLNSSNSALRIEAFANRQQISTTTKQSSVLGFGSRALMLFYF